MALLQLTSTSPSRQAVPPWNPSAGAKAGVRTPQLSWLPEGLDGTVLPSATVPMHLSGADTLQKCHGR